MSSTQLEMSTGRPVESSENLWTMVTMYKQGKTAVETHTMLTPSAVEHSVDSVKRRFQNIDYIVSGGLRGCSQYRNELYDIVYQLYPGQIKPKTELPRKRKSKQK